MSSSNTKKRRVGGDTPAAETDNNNNELIAMKSSIDELVHQNRTQNENIANILQLMKGMQDEMKDMRGEITQLRQKCDDMHTKLNENADSANHKLKYHDMLLQNQKWKYSARHPSDDYWNSVQDSGLDYEANAFVTEIKKCTEKMRYCTGDDHIDFSIATDHLPYNNELLPHWREFATALEQYQYHLEQKDPKLFSIEQNGYTSSLSRLCLGEMELPEEVLNLLSKALKSTHFQHVVFSNNKFSQKGIDFALDCLESNHKCKHFELHDDPCSMKDIERCSEIVKDHPSIERLTLYECKGDDVQGYEMLKLIMTAGRKKLKHVDLSSNNINTRGGAFIPIFLAGNHMLKSLAIKENHLDDDDVAAIAAALAYNTKMETLELGDNDNITSRGWKTLSKAVFDKTSLNAAADSNHTCQIDFPLHDDTYEQIREMNGSTSYHMRRFVPTKVRQKKIYSILSKRNRTMSNVDHFDDDKPVELLPDMLHSIQKCADYHVLETDTDTDEDKKYSPPQDNSDVKPLSIMFEILQRWDKSLAVFEALSS